MIKRKALVTGGTRGIGKSIVKKLKKKYNLYFTGQIYKKNKNYLQLNLADINSVNKFIKKISKMNFDILVNNAGINNIKYLNDYS
jgi:short-subunit dehydrogenase